GAFIEDLNDDVVNVLSRAAVEGRGIGQMLLGLSNGVVARVPMTATAYPLRGTGLSTLIAAEWDKPEARARAERWVAEIGAALRPYARRAYVNYLPPSTPERIREIYGVNYPRWHGSRRSTIRRTCSAKTRIFGPKSSARIDPEAAVVTVGLGKPVTSTSPFSGRRP